MRPDYFKGKVFTADSNYHTQVNLKECQELGLDAYIPDRKFRNRDPRFATQKRRQMLRFTLKDFHHDEALDQYICPNGKILKLRAKRVIDHGHLYRKYLATEKDCQTCPLRPQCIYGAGAKRKQLSVPIGESLSKQMVEKIDTEQGRRIYPQRLAIAEPVFANGVGCLPDIRVLLKIWKRVLVLEGSPARFVNVVIEDRLPGEEVRLAFTAAQRVLERFLSELTDAGTKYLCNDVIPGILTE